MYKFGGRTMKKKITILIILFLMFPIASSISMPPGNGSGKLSPNADFNTVDILPESEDIICGIAAAAVVMPAVEIETAVLY